MRAIRSAPRGPLCRNKFGHRVGRQNHTRHREPAKPATVFLFRSCLSLRRAAARLTSWPCARVWCRPCRARAHPRAARWRHHDLLGSCTAHAQQGGCQAPASVCRHGSRPAAPPLRRRRAARAPSGSCAGQPPPLPKAATTNPLRTRHWLDVGLKLQPATVVNRHCSFCCDGHRTIVAACRPRGGLVHLASEQTVEPEDCEYGTGSGHSTAQCYAQAALAAAP